jgi:hypothetical protein
MPVNTFLFQGALNRIHGSTYRLLRAEVDLPGVTAEKQTQQEKDQEMRSGTLRSPYSASSPPHPSLPAARAPSPEIPFDWRASAAAGSSHWRATPLQTPCAAALAPPGTPTARGPPLGPHHPPAVCRRIRRRRGPRAGEEPPLRSPPPQAGARAAPSPTLPCPSHAGPRPGGARSRTAQSGNRSTPGSQVGASL